MSVARSAVASAALMLLACARPSSTADATKPDGASEPAEAGTSPTTEGEARTEDESAYPGYLGSVGALDRDFLARQKIRAQYGEQKLRFEAVVQKKGDQLVVLGLTPFGSRAFTLRQEGEEVHFEAYVDRELPFPPQFILKDIHRAFLWDMHLDGEPPADGERSLEVHDERVRESFEGGVLRRRSFERLDQNPSGELVIEYSGSPVGKSQSWTPSEQASLKNRWYGYELSIETVEYRLLGND